MLPRRHPIPTLPLLLAALGGVHFLNALLTRNVDGVAVDPLHVPALGRLVHQAVALAAQVFDKLCQRVPAVAGVGELGCVALL